MSDVKLICSELPQDCWNDSYLSAPGDGSAWLSGNCSVRVLRGGSWNYFLDDLRSANRYYIITGGRNNILGFRAARTLD